MMSAASPAPPNSSTLDHFDYAQAPLPDASQTIRLLEIQPSSLTASSAAADDQYSAALVCTMRTTSISNPEPFIALSYCWGSDQRSHTLSLYGKTFPITSSLNEALRHIRDPARFITIWIDQICINQNDNAEKSAQVGEMRSIYSKCEQVIVWLEPAADDSDFLMEWWQRTGQAARDLGIEKLFTREKVGELLAMERNADPQDDMTRKYKEIVRDAHVDIERVAKSIVAWTSRAWFSRVWIIQEMALCPDTMFVCGHKTVGVGLVMLAGHIFQVCMKLPLLDSPSTPEYVQLVGQAQDQLPAQLFSTRRRRQHFHANKGAGDQLFNLLRGTFVGRKTRATQARDRIYGLLGLAVDADSLRIEPDYISTSDAPAFISSAHAMIRGGRIEMLSFSQFPKEVGLQSLPSWVPDWRPNLDPSFYTIYEYAEDDLLAASGNTSVSLIPDKDANILGLKGFMVDQIEEVGSIWQDSDSHEMYLAFLQKIRDFCDSSTRKDQDIYPSLERRNEAFWRVPVGDLYWTRERDYERANASSREDYDDCLAILGILLEAGPASPERQKEQMAVILARRMGSSRYRINMATLTGKQPFLTRKGYVGMCCHNAQPGDAVVVFCGARIAHVLRPVAGGRFAYLGEAYCDGVMDGEIVVPGKEIDFLIE